MNDEDDLEDRPEPEIIVAVNGRNYGFSPKKRPSPLSKRIGDDYNDTIRRWYAWAKEEGYGDPYWKMIHLLMAHCAGEALRCEVSREDFVKLAWYFYDINKEANPPKPKGSHLRLVAED